MFGTITKLFDSRQRDAEIQEDARNAELDADLAQDMYELNNANGKVRRNLIRGHDKDHFQKERNRSEDEFIQEVAGWKESCARKRSNTSNRGGKLMSMDEIKEEAKKVSKRGWCWLG